MLIQRIITAIILITLVIAGVFKLPLWVCKQLAALIVCLAAWEYSGLFHWGYLRRISFLMIPVGFIALLWAIAYWLSYDVAMMTLYILVVVGALWWLIAPYFLWRYTKAGANSFIKPMLLGIIIFISCIAALFVLGRYKLFLLLMIVWAADIGAYFTGKLLGKHLLAPRISPKKTIEGVVGGVLLSLFTTMVVNVSVFPLTKDLKKLLALLLLTIVVSLYSVVGDLFESMLKREAGVKDSGNLLPGHGGIYDRIDALIAAAPIFAVGCMLIEFLT